ncbi:MAG: hypothetical protein ACRELX_03305, partial [Longimicrobiales bacterium]
FTAGTERVVIAADAATGATKLELGVQVDTVEAVIGSSSPPLVFDDVVVVGLELAVGLRPPSRTNVPGRVLAFDARTAALNWRFHTIPGEGEAGVETWESESWRYTGNAGARRVRCRLLDRQRPRRDPVAAGGTDSQAVTAPNYELRHLHLHWGGQFPPIHHAV